MIGNPQIEKQRHNSEINQHANNSQERADSLSKKSELTRNEDVIFEAFNEKMNSIFRYESEEEKAKK